MSPTPTHLKSTPSPLPPTPTPVKSKAVDNNGEKAGAATQSPSKRDSKQKLFLYWTYPSFLMSNYKMDFSVERFCLMVDPIGGHSGHSVLDYKRVLVCE